MTQRTFSRFNRRSTFNCMVCGRLTRDVDQGGTDLCPECYELAGHDNQVNDSGEALDPKSMAQCEKWLAAIGKKGGDMAKAKASCDYLWPNG